ncbi:hypothetical protein [Spiroplasma syrphidicola]|nr:hypothetical protein [Spiroplasma syrphidicola]
MDVNVLQAILAKKEITTKDKIVFKLINSVLTTLFIDENRQSLLQVGYKINEQEYLWFPNLSLDNKKEQNINDGYANYLSSDGNFLYQFTATTAIDKRKSQGEKYLQNKIHFVTFGKINDKKKGIGYHFLGIFIFVGFTDEDCQTMIYQKIRDNYQLDS